MGSTRKQVHLFRRYLWLYECITSHGPITFEGIRERWERSSLSSGDTLPHKTFENHRQAVQELFDVEIVCNRRDNTYYIPDTYPDGSNRIRHLSLVESLGSFMDTIISSANKDILTLSYLYPLKLQLSYCST